MIAQIRDQLSTLSDEAIEAAVRRADADGFDKSRGILPLGEAIETLINSRDLLEALDKKRKLDSMPGPATTELLPILRNLSTHLTNLANGSDVCPSLVEQIEQLHFFVWRYRLDNLSDQIVGYENKKRQLRNLVSQAKTLKRELETALQQKPELESLMVECRRCSTDANKLQQVIQQQRDEASDHAQQAGAALTTTRNHQNAASEILAKALASGNQVNTIEAELKKLYQQGQAFRKDISDNRLVAQETVEKNTNRTEEMIKQLQDLEVQINDALHRATGVSLFESYQTRREQLAKGKLMWTSALTVLVLLALAASYWIASSSVPLTMAFYLKLAIAPPIAFAVWFCTSQYSRERRLEEEYAFKANISVSLTAYRKLIEEVLDKEDGDSRSRYCEFIIDSVDKVFTSPLDHSLVTPDHLVRLQTIEKMTEKMAQFAHIVVDGSKKIPR